MPTHTPEISATSRPVSLTHRRTPSSTRSAMTEAVWRSMRIGRASDERMSAQKFVTAIVIWSGASLTPTTRAASGLSLSMTRGRPRPASRTAPTCSGTISRSSRSAAVMADTVVALNSVDCEISTRETGPKRLIASITWKRLIARISSGSAVFIAVEGCAFAQFFTGGGFIPIPAASCQAQRHTFLRIPLSFS